jgi:hypothetical protein
MSYLRKVFSFLTRGNKAGTSNCATQQKWVENKLISLSSGLRILDAGAGEQQYKNIAPI